PVHLSQECIISDLVLNRQPLILVPIRFEKIDERNSLAISTAVNQGFVGGNCRTSQRAGRANRHTQIIAAKIFANSFEGEEKECTILTDRSSYGPAKLFPMKIVKRLTIRGICGQCL